MATNRSHWLKVVKVVPKLIQICKTEFFLSAFVFLNIPSHLMCHFYSLDAGFFQYNQDVKQFRSRFGLTFCRAWSGSKLFAKVISRQQKSTLVGKDLNIKQLVDTTFWLNPWLKLISFGSNFLHSKWLKCWLQQILSQDKPWITFANSLSQDQARQNVRLDLDPNCLTFWYSWNSFLEKVGFE